MRLNGKCLQSHLGAVITVLLPAMPLAGVWAGLVRIQDHSWTQISMSHISLVSYVAAADFRRKAGRKGRKFSIVSSNTGSLTQSRCFSIFRVAHVSLELWNSQVFCWPPLLQNESCSFFSKDREPLSFRAV